MLNGLYAQNQTFLSDINQIQNRITAEDRQITSGARVSQASDDPSAVTPILSYQNQIDQVTQVQKNLTVATTISQTADSALQSASTLLDQVLSIATQGASTTTSASQRAMLGTQVQGLAESLVNLANTTVGGKYIFGGDDPTTQPYTLSWSTAPTSSTPPASSAYATPGGVIPKAGPFSNTEVTRNASGGTMVLGMTAQQIFDARNPDGTVASGNVFQAVYEIGQALQNNPSTFSTDIATGMSDLKAAMNQISLATTSNGNDEAWLQNSSSDASSLLANLQTAFSAVHDTDVTSAIVQLTTDQTALQASLAAHASLPSKSLFDYLG